MTEAEWLACDDPLRMLRSAHKRRHFPAPQRRWLLLACAAARRGWGGFRDPPPRAPEAPER